jgi:hypothetical protein
MLRLAHQFRTYAEAARFILDSSRENTKPDSHDYFVAVARLQRLLEPHSDERLPHLRHLLETAPNLDLIVRIADDPTIARLALEAQTAVTELREQIFFGDREPPMSAQMGRIYRALTDGVESADDLRMLEEFWFELTRAYTTAVALSLLTMAIGKHRSSWSRDRRWRNVPQPP